MGIVGYIWLFDFRKANSEGMRRVPCCRIESTKSGKMGKIIEDEVG